jgi:peroxin-19
MSWTVIPTSIIPHLTECILTPIAPPPDLLDQFTPAPSSVLPSASNPPPQSAAASIPATKDAPNTEPFSDDFEAALAREMEAMMQAEMGQTSGGSTNDLATAWQKMLIEDLEGTSEQENMTDLLKNLGVGTNSGPAENSDAAPDAAFQRTIRQAIDKLKSSDESARASETGLGADAESFAEFLKQLGEAENTEDGGEGLQGMIENMMGQLMSKDILYEPLVEMNSKVSTTSTWRIWACD